VDNRGSKSALIYRFKAVKEKRVDGSFCVDNTQIRCILTDFERNYQIKIHSNQIIQKRLYSSISSQNMVNQSTLNPWFITVFSDAESCFMVQVRKNYKYRTG
jgi:hypothetical protein